MFDNDVNYINALFLPAGGTGGKFWRLFVVYRYPARTPSLFLLCLGVGSAGKFCHAIEAIVLGVATTVVAFCTL